MYPTGPSTLPDDDRSRLWRFAPAIFAILIAVAAALAFGWPTLNAGFQMGDDQRFVTENVLVNHPSGQHAWEILSTTHGDLYQPVPMLSFQSDYALSKKPAAGGAISPFVFHLTNVILHAINAALVVLVITRLSGRWLIGGLTGLLFATHPLAQEAVAWVSGRMILLATTFSLIVLLFAVRRSSESGFAWRFGTIIAWIFSLASKVMPTVPIVAAIFDRTAHRTRQRVAWWSYAVLFALGIAATIAMTKTTDAAGFAHQEKQSISDSLGTMVLASGQYIENYVWPKNLSPWTPPLESVEWQSQQMYIAGGLLLLLSIVTLALWRRWPVAATGLASFLILLAPFLVAGVTRRLFVADRYMYLPILGLHLFVVVFVSKSVTAFVSRRYINSVRFLTAAPVVALAAFFIVTAYELAPTWQNPISYARRIVETHPDSPMAANELARAYVHEGDASSALQIVNRAREKWPDEPRLAAQAGAAWALLGDDAAAERELATAVESMPEHVATRYQYALILRRLDRTDDALEQLDRIIEDAPEFAPAYRAKALVLRDLGQSRAEEEMLISAIRVNPHHRDNLFDLANIQMARGDYDRAEENLRRILDLNKNDQPALLNLGAILSKKGQTVDAIKCYDQILQRNSRTVTALLNRAALLKQINQPRAAKADLRTVIEVAPNNLEARVSLHEILFIERDWRELSKLWETISADESGSSACFAAWIDPIAAFDREDDPKLISSKVDYAAQGPCRRFLAMYVALRAGDELRLQSLITADLGAFMIPLNDYEQRVILPAFSALPNHIRNSGPGLVVLAALVHATGDAAGADRVLQSINESAHGQQWFELSKKMSAAWETNPQGN